MTQLETEISSGQKFQLPSSDPTDASQAINLTSLLAQNTQLSDRQSTLTSEISAYGTFSSALSTLQATLTTLKTSAALAGRTATLGDTTIATGTATANAIPAQYSLTVQNLATAASLSSNAFAN